MAVNQQMIDALKKQYTTVDAVQASDTFKKAGTDIQNQILSYYQPAQKMITDTPKAAPQPA